MAGSNRNGHHSNPDAADLVGREFFARAVVGLGGARRFVIGDGLGMLERAAVLRVSADAGRPESVAGNLTQYTDRRGKITVYQYDGLNRRTFAGFGQNGCNYESTITIYVGRR